MINAKRIVNFERDGLTQFCRIRVETERRMAERRRGEGNLKRFELTFIGSSAIVTYTHTHPLPPPLPDKLSWLIASYIYTRVLLAVRAPPSNAAAPNE